MLYLTVTCKSEICPYLTRQIFSHFYLVKVQIRENNFQLFLSRSPLLLAFRFSWVSFYFAPSSIWCLLSPLLDTPILLLTCYRDSDTTPSPSPQLGDSQSPNYLGRPKKATNQHNYWCYPSLATFNMMQQAATNRHGTSQWGKSRVYSLDQSSFNRLQKCLIKNRDMRQRILSLT